MFKRSKIISLALASVLALSLAAPTFAADDATNKETVVTAGYKDVPVAVVIPTTGEVKLNPYGLPVSYNLNEEGKAEVVGQQITTEPMAIMNQSSVDLQIGAKVTATKVGGVSMSTTKPTYAAGDTSKTIYVELQVLSVDPATEAATLKKLAGDSTDANTLNDAVIKACAEESNWTTTTTNSGSTTTTLNSNVKALAFDTDTAGYTSTNLGTVKKAKTAVTDTEPAVYAVGSIALFRLSGVCNPNAAWAAKTESATGDGFTATIAFTFTPVV